MTQVEGNVSVSNEKKEHGSLNKRKVDLSLKLKKVLKEMDRTERELKENDESKSG